MKSSIKTFTAAIILFSSILAGHAQNVGDVAPEFILKNTLGDDVKLSSLEGKVVFIYLFGSTCPICIGSGNKTQKDVQGVYGHRDDFQALGLDTWDGTLSEVLSFGSQTELTYELLLNASSVQTNYNTTYDRVMVVGADGSLRHKGTGSVSSSLNDAITVIDELLMTLSTEGPEHERSFVSVYPNPAQDFTRVSFAVENESSVRISILNNLGQEVIKGYPERVTAGTHSREMAINDLSPGLYFVRLDLPGGTRTHKLLVNR